MNKIRYRQMFVALSTALILLNIGAASAGAKTNAGTSSASVSLEPQIINVVSGESCTLQLIVNTEDSLSCMDCLISFDTSLVTLTSVDEGELFIDAPFLTFFDWGYVAPDTVSVVDCVMGYRSFLLPPGELVSFTFEAKNPGVCPVRISEMKLWDIDRNAVQTTFTPAAWINIDTPTGAGAQLAKNGHLTSYPNPFNPVTTIAFSLPAAAHTNLSIFTPGGKLVITLADELLAEGRKEFVWNGIDANGTPASSGVYFCRLRYGETVFTQKIVLVK